MSAPLVSVLVPTYNGERFLGETLRSALAQTHREIEVLVGDDSSADGTADLLRDVAATDARVRVLRHESALGAWGNSLRLLAEARGQYVKFLYHDDLLAPDCVTTLVRGLESSRDVTLAFSHRAIIDEAGRTIEGASPLVLMNEGLYDGRLLGDTLLTSCRNIIGEPSTCLFRRDDVDPDDLVALEGRPLVGNEDVALWLRLLGRGKAYYTPRTLSSFRRHGGQVTHDPRVLAGGALDWPRMIDWARRTGFLADPDDERHAHMAALEMATATLSALPGSTHTGELLEAVFLSTTRLAELQTGGAAEDQPLSQRAHSAAFLERLTQGLDARSRRHAVAVAVPTADPAEVTATIAALREAQAADAAEQLLLAVSPALVEDVVRLVEDALAEGPDLDIDLVPTDDPGALLRDGWLVVTPRGRSWHRTRKVPVWVVEVPASVGGGEDRPAGPFVHQQGICESTHVGPGTRIWAFSHVLSGARIGADCNICDHVFVENDVVVGDRVTVKCGVQLWDGVRLADDVFVGPNVTFTNDPYPRSKAHPASFPATVVEHGASIGANATILPGLTIGRKAMVGAGAVVTRDVPPRAVVVGNPARVVGSVDDRSDGD